jgi:DNA adenine methylase
VLPCRPALRWYGGKWRLAPWIIRHLPPHQAYCEPYGGAGSVLLRKAPATLETFNDLHGRLVNFFTVLRERPEELADAIELTPYARTEFQLAHRVANDRLEDACRLFVLANQGRAGAASGRSRSGWRTARNPGHPNPPREFTAAHLAAIAQRLKRVQIEHDDALAVIARYDTPETLHYLDPPYLRATRSATSSGRYAHDLSEADHRALAELLHRLQGMVVLSGYPSQLYEQLYAKAGWERVDRQARTDKARPRVESLWLNPPAQRRLRPSRPPTASTPDHR